MSSSPSSSSRNAATAAIKMASSTLVHKTAKAKASRNEDETRLLIDDQDDDQGASPAVASSSASSGVAGSSSASGDGAQIQPPPSLPPQLKAKLSKKAMSDFVFIKIVARLALTALRRFWRAASASILAIILFYWLCGGIVATLLVVAAVTGILYHAGDRLLYHPDQPPTSRVFVPAPSVVGLPFESVYIKSRDRTRIHLFLIKQPPERISEAPTFLFLHGNAGNIGHRLLNVKSLYSQLQCNVCMLEYRGYGHSDGTPSEDGIYMDAQAGLDYLSSRSDINPSRIVVFGRSLGGGVAVELGARSENREKISCLLVENTFTSIPDIARALFDFRAVRCLPDWCYKNQFRSRWKVCHVSCPVLFLSGQADQLVPPKMMTELFSSCGSEHKRMARFPGGTHNETWGCAQYYYTIRYFLEEVAKVRPCSVSDASTRSPPPNFYSEVGSTII